MFKKIRILVADDDVRLQNELRDVLQNAGYEVIIANNGVETVEQAQVQEPDLILLDVIMPRKDGFQTLQEIRESLNTPVIMLSSQGMDYSRIKGLNLGADDYIMKPLNMDELKVRITAVLNRTGNARNENGNDALAIGGMTIDTRKHSVTGGNKTYFLTLIEWQLLMELVLNPGKLIEYRQLLVKVWGPEYINDIQLLRTWVSRLRKKIEINSKGPLIKTIRKTGYIFDG